MCSAMNQPALTLSNMMTGGHADRDCWSLWNGLNAALDILRSRFRV